MAKRKPKTDSGDVATNRRARHKFELLDRFECGIELVGTEVKSLREGKAQLGDAYAVIERGEVWLRNAHIPPYAPAAGQNHDPERPRKLLLHRYEIERLIGRSERTRPDADPDPDLLQGPARQGRAGPGSLKGAARPPSGDPRPRRPARGRAGAPPPPPLSRGQPAAGVIHAVMLPWQAGRRARRAISCDDRGDALVQAQSRWRRRAEAGAACAPSGDGTGARPGSAPVDATAIRRPANGAPGARRATDASRPRPSPRAAVNAASASVRSDAGRSSSGSRKNRPSASRSWPSASGAGRRNSAGARMRRRILRRGPPPQARGAPRRQAS